MIASFLSLLASATVTVQPDIGYLRASFVLDEAVKSYTFAPNDTPQRSDSWTVTEAGWVFDGETIIREDGATFSAFKFSLKPDPRFHDRRYVAVSKVGDGWALYLAAFGGVSGATNLKFHGLDQSDVIRLPGFQGGSDDLIATDGNDRRIVYVGPSDQIHRKEIELIAGPELPSWVADSLTRGSNHVAATLKKRLGRETMAPPTIIASHSPDRDDNSRKGGTLDGATILVNIASDHTDFNQSRADDIERFAAHEIVHLWLNEIWDTTENNEKPWLHEGAAEYLADRITLDNVAFRKETTRHLQGCLNSLRGRPLDSPGMPIYGQTPYDCGFTLQFIAELASVKRRRGDILSLWRAVVEAAHEGKYDSRLFLKIASERGGQRFDAASTALLNTRGDLKSLALGAALVDLGVSVTTEDAGAAHGALLLRPALLAFLQSQCTGTYGFHTEPDAYRLSSDMQCGPLLSNGPRLTGVNGYSLTKAAFDAYKSIRRACSEGASLTFETVDHGKLDPIKCTANIPEPGSFATLSTLPKLPNLK